MNKKVGKVFLFEADEETIYERALNRRICVPCDKIYGWGKAEAAPTVCEKCGATLTVRSDDNVESIKTRLDIYHSQIDPIIAHYKEQGILEAVDALDAPEKVLESVK